MELMIIKIGVDVHSKSYSLCAMEPVLGGKHTVLRAGKIEADSALVVKFIEQLKKDVGNAREEPIEFDIECGYEADWVFPLQGAGRCRSYLPCAGTCYNAKSEGRQANQER